ncbi:MAG: glycogen debranching protein GlgX [Gammaproteobacteria bacterium]|nr:glycogen debranching protein GlgX [Gammaproteobacteria bacterium]
MARASYRTAPGQWIQGGATVVQDGVNFCAFSRCAESIELLLFEHDDSTEPFQVISLEPETHRTFYFWHVLVLGLPEGVFYNWRVLGSSDTRVTGSRIDPDKALLDPWATTVTDRLWSREAASRPGDNVAHAMRAMVQGDAYDWEGDNPLYIPLSESVIYEMHVGGFTRHPSSGVEHPGTFAGVIEKIPHLQALGITHVELMPVMAFDHQDLPPGTAALGLSNYWGYSTHSFYAPHPRFTVQPRHARDEFRDMVKALHRGGIGVILDVVFNHTSEGGPFGPTINFKAFGNEMFYHLDFTDRTRYRDYTGCGNTVNCNHPMVSRFLIDALRYWVEEMHVDGFRFDLASAMARGEDGKPLYHAPMLWHTELSPFLSRTHIIAEAWDAAGLYQLGDFPGYRWAEWNGRYRDVIRAFVRGDTGILSEVATRLCGSSDLYASRGRLPWNSINFVTCHDGYTLWDLVSYEAKHNLANGEDNRDGHNHNLSANYGVEGPSDDPHIDRLRRRQARNFIAILMLSQGVPMLHGSDELLATKRGNNNTYCQDNELSWQDWRLVQRNADMLTFVQGMIRLRRRHPCLSRARFLTGRPGRDSGLPDISWHGTELDAAPWDDPTARHLAFTLAGATRDEPPLHIVLNMSEQARAFALPRLSRRRWHLAIDTAQEPAVFEPGDQALIRSSRIEVQARSVVVLESRPT